MIAFAWINRFRENFNDKTDHTLTKTHQILKLKFLKNLTESTIKRRTFFRIRCITITSLSLLGTKTKYSLCAGCTPSFNGRFTMCFNILQITSEGKKPGNISSNTLKVVSIKMKIILEPLHLTKSDFPDKSNHFLFSIVLPNLFRSTWARCTFPYIFSSARGG